MTQERSLSPIGVKAAPSSASPRWHALSSEEIAARLGSGAGGLDPAEAARRLASHGPNELQASRSLSPWPILLAQFKNLLILILLAATALSALLGHEIEGIAIAVIVLFAVLLGFLQEFRAERALTALRQMAAPLATVVRGGREQRLPAREVVPGDLLLVRAGDRIPADARLLESANLAIDEAALTGESLPVDKGSASLPDQEIPLGDRTNMLFAGTAALFGRGRALVVATGMSTELGGIARMLQTIEVAKTPLQRNLDRLGGQLARIALGVVAVIVVLGLVRGQPVIEMLVFGIALAVAVVPEALPAVVTISLALGVQRMVRRHALVRRLPAVETLGSTSYICTDKTGTLTRDEMTVRRLVAPGISVEVTGAGYEPAGQFLREGRDEGIAQAGDDHPIRRLLRAAVLASDARIEREEGSGAWVVTGDPTEGALVVAAAKAGMAKDRLDAAAPRLGEVPFTSEAKRMTVLVGQRDGGSLACSKGAPEVILASCDRYLAGGEERRLDGMERECFLEEARAMAGQALRVLAVASRSAARLPEAGQGMTFLGLAGMIDPPRPEARPAIDRCREAGIRPVMITGDHPLTAEAVARELGLFAGGRVVTGPQLEAMSDEELERSVEGIEVYARVSPAHKLRVVTALQKRGKIVAMTGDGVNDAPALKKADIGVAMGITGTEVSKEAAAMTLTDDNFASIVAAVEEGRGVFGNIKKYLMYLLSSNIGEIGLMAGATLAGLPLPLSAVQILYVNLATDGLPALALAVDPPEADLMRREPRDPKRGIFTPSVVTLILAGGIWSTLVNLGLFAWALASGRSVHEAMTMSFVSLVLIQFFKAFNFRSDHHSVMDHPFANRWLNLAILWELLLLALIVYLPFLHAPFGTFSLSPADLLIILALAFSVSPVLELVKWMVRLRAHRAGETPG